MKIDYNKLMIGDWIYNQKIDKNDKIDSITNEVGVTTLCNNEIHNEIKPIELTNEILELNGFTRKPAQLGTMGQDDVMSLENHYEQYIIELEEDEYDVYDILNKEHCVGTEDCYWLNIVRGATTIDGYVVKYVHELQQLFRVLGLNKLANDFKV